MPLNFQLKDFFLDIRMYTTHLDIEERFMNILWLHKGPLELLWHVISYLHVYMSYLLKLIKVLIIIIIVIIIISWRGKHIVAACPSVSPSNRLVPCPANNFKTTVGI